MIIEFERSTVEDSEEILSLINALSREWMSRIIPKEHFREPFLTHEQVEKMGTYMEFHVLRAEEKIIAVGSFGTLDEHTAWIPLMYVASKFHRQGIGSALVKHLEGIARKQHFSKVRLETDSGAHWALSFYEKHGYSIVAKEKNPWGYHVWLEKALPDK
ncbi:MAG: GNAT family N-acetyltransferase [Candidatus Thorarchaeota archaeon]